MTYVSDPPIHLVCIIRKSQYFCMFVGDWHTFWSIVVLCLIAYLPIYTLFTGIKQSGIELNDVLLPPWAKGDPREFIRMHREVG